MDATDRVVLVSAGFGIWQAGRHLASARWSDVVRVRAMSTDAGTTDASVLALSLRDGTEILVPETLPGFDPFFDAAETTLSGLSRKGSWLAGMGNSGVAEQDTILFDRYPPRV